MSADEELRSLAARCPRSLLESFLIEKIRAQEAPTLDDLRTAWKKSRPQAWSSSALFEWLPEGLFPEILSRLDARRMGLVARTCRAFAESVVVASELRAAHLCLRLPTSAEQSVLRHLWFAERVGVTGLAWEVCAAPVIAEHPAGDYLPSIIVRHIKSGLMMILDTTSNGWVDLTIRGLERHVLSDCARTSSPTQRSLKPPTCRCWTICTRDSLSCRGITMLIGGFMSAIDAKYIWSTQKTQPLAKASMLTYSRA